MAIYQPTDARPLGELMVAYRSKDNQWSRHMSPQRPVGPAVLIRQHGKGKVVCVPCALDAAFVGDFRMAEHRKLLRNLVRYLNPRPAVLVDAPPNVEIVVTHDTRRQRLLVHFLCFSGSPTSAAVAFPKGTRVLPPVMEEAMHYEARVRVAEPFAHAAAAGADTTVAVQGSEIAMQTSQPHEVLVIH